MINEYINWLISLSLVDKIQGIVVLFPIALGLWKLVKLVDKYEKI